MDRLIFHCDCNNFYASCEILEHPELRDVPMAVAGDPERRTGIVVAKNELAKRAGIKTTDTVWAAKKKCPGIVFVPPRHKYYEEISGMVNAIYRQYTEYVEPASIDESYLDMSGTPKYYGKTPVEIADEIRRRIREEIGITISIGISFNKVFAKMGSDYKKPDATTEITRANYKDILWPLPVSDLLYAGRATVEVLKKSAILTVGDLAIRPQAYLHDLLGKGGDQLWIYANGLDESPVRLFGEHEEIKSISKGMTFRRNLITEAEVKTGLAALVDEIAMQLRRQQLKASVIQVQIKTPQMNTISRQMKLDHYTCLQHEINETALKLVKSNWNIGPLAPIRALTACATGLMHADQVVEQLSLFDFTQTEADGRTKADRDKQEKLEAAVDLLRRKHGNKTITLGMRPKKNFDL